MPSTLLPRASDARWGMMERLPLFVPTVECSSVKQLGGAALPFFPFFQKSDRSRKTRPGLFPVHGSDCPRGLRLHAV